VYGIDHVDFSVAMVDARAVDERPAPHTAPGTTEWIHICDRCGDRMEERKCKIVCARCGYSRDCSDP
jgi:hypothetical protein